MLRWYLSPIPNFFSDWLWPYCAAFEEGTNVRSEPAEFFFSKLEGEARRSGGASGGGGSGTVEEKWTQL